MNESKGLPKKGIQDQAIQTCKAYDRVIPAVVNANVNTKASSLSSATAIATTSQVDILAKLYLESDLAEISAATIRAPSLDVQKIIYSENVLRSAAHLFLERTPVSKIVFP